VPGCRRYFICPIWDAGHGFVVDPNRSALGSGDSYFLPPKDVQEFVTQADTVVIATVGSVITTGRESPNGTDGNLMTEDIHALPFTWFSLTVDRVILDDGNIKANPVLRLFGNTNATGISQGGTISPAFEVNFMVSPVTGQRS
jgi:hypothetical protein